jgi:hypothetical protein
MNFRRIRARDGSALLIVLGSMLVLSAMGLALLLLAISHTLTAGNQRRATAALLAAEAGVERALPDLLRAPDWDSVLDGRVRSGLTDGPGGGVRRLPDGRSLNLDEVLALANCGAPIGCTEAQMNAVTTERPWGPNNPRWRLFAHGPLSALLPGPAVLTPSEYLVVLVADDALEVDGDPLRDGRPGASAGAGVLRLRAEAFGPESSHRAVEVTVARNPGQPATAGYAAQRGQGTAGGLGTTGDVQVPGEALVRSEMTLSGGMTRR